MGKRLAVSTERPTGFAAEWFAPQAAAELLHFRSLIAEYASQDVLRVVLARAARSARLTTHFDLDFPRAPQQGEYWCHKHRRTCRPVESAGKFLTRYLTDTAARIRAFAEVRDPRRAALVLHGDARELELGGPYDGVVTSPPYPGLIDYHEQHRYAYELLGLDDRRERELGAAARGTSKAAIEEYVTGIAAVLSRVRTVLRRGAPVCIVVNDRRGSTRRSSSVRACGSTSGSSGTSTGARAAAPVSTTNRYSSVAERLGGDHQPAYGGSRRSTSFQ